MEYYEETIKRYRVYKRPTLKLENGSRYPWQLEWSSSDLKFAESKLQRPSYESAGLYIRKLVDAEKSVTIHRSVL
tara:strand:- start:7764 stop:7988 length:225 start_codon:yes stop_codon:yes gene_type:complete